MRELVEGEGLFILGLRLVLGSFGWEGSRGKSLF